MTLTLPVSALQPGDRLIASQRVIVSVQPAQRAWANEPDQYNVRLEGDIFSWRWNAKTTITIERDGAVRCGSFDEMDT